MAAVPWAGGQAPKFDDATLANADYVAGRRSFQRRCSACHTLNEGGLDLAGPNLWRLFEREPLASDGFAYSPSIPATAADVDRRRAWPMAR